MNKVGTVCIGLATPTGTITVKVLIPAKKREEVRMIATQRALDMVRRYLTGLPVEMAEVV